MAKARNPDRIKAEEIYLEHKGNIELVKIAEMLDRPSGTVRGWKNKDRWDEKLNGTFQEKDNIKAERYKRKKGGQPGNKNAIGHGAPSKNKNAEKHGFFSKYLPGETLDLIQEIKVKNPLDILWENIQLQYAAIIRSQRIMYVQDKKEMIKELKKSKYEIATIDDESEQLPIEEEYEIQFAWDKQATFLKAQSRAMGELRSMIKRYEEILKTDLATEEQKARIAKIKADTDKIKATDDDKPIEVVIKRKGEG